MVHFQMKQSKISITPRLFLNILQVNIEIQISLRLLEKKINSQVESINCSNHISKTFLDCETPVVKHWWINIIKHKSSLTTPLLGIFVQLRKKESFQSLDDNKMMISMIYLNNVISLWWLEFDMIIISIHKVLFLPWKYVALSFGHLVTHFIKTFT